MLVALGVCLFVVKNENATLIEQIGEQQLEIETATDNFRVAEKLKKQVARDYRDSKLAIAAVARLIQRLPDDDALVEKLSLLSNGPIRCSVHQISIDPDLRLIVLGVDEQSHAPKDYTARLFGPKKATTMQPGICLLVLRENCKIVDWACHEGRKGVSEVFANPWSVHWRQLNDLKISYDVTPSGFTPIQ